MVLSEEEIIEAVMAGVRKHRGLDRGGPYVEDDLYLRGAVALEVLRAQLEKLGLASQPAKGGMQ